MAENHEQRVLEPRCLHVLDDKRRLVEVGRRGQVEGGRSSQRRPGGDGTRTEQRGTRVQCYVRGDAQRAKRNNERSHGRRSGRALAITTAAKDREGGREGVQKRQHHQRRATRREPSVDGCADSSAGRAVGDDGGDDDDDDGKQNVAPNRTRDDGDRRTFVHRTLQGRHVKGGRGENAFRLE